MPKGWKLSQNVANWLRLRFAHSVMMHSSHLLATHALMLLTVTPRVSLASCGVCHLRRPGRFEVHTPHVLAKLLGAACTKSDSIALSRSVSRRRRGCLVANCRAHRFARGSSARAGSLLATHALRRSLSLPGGVWQAVDCRNMS